MKKVSLFVAILETVLLGACSAAKPIQNRQEESSSTGKVVIVYYDSEIGDGPLAKTIKEEHCEIVYRYNNFNAYALKISGEKIRKKIEKTKGVLSVQDDRRLELDGTK